MRDLPRRREHLGRERGQDAHHDRHAAGHQPGRQRAGLSDGADAETSAAVFETFDLSAQDQFPNDKASPTTTAEIVSAAQPTASGWYPNEIAVKLDGQRRVTAPGVEQLQYRIDGGTTAADRDPRHRDLTVPEGDRTSSSTARSTASATRSRSSPCVRRSTRPPRTTTATTLPAYGAERLVRRPGRGQLPRRRRRGLGHREDRVALRRRRMDGSTQDAWACRPLGHATSSSTARPTPSATSRRPRRSSSRSTPRRPSTTPLLNGAAPGADYAGAVRVEFTRSDGDDGSGAVGTEYRINGGEWTTYTGAFDLTTVGRLPDRLPLVGPGGQRRALQVAHG